MEEKKKHIANRKPAAALNDGLRFDQQLKVKKEKIEGQLYDTSKKSNSTNERK